MGIADEVKAEQGKPTQCAVCLWLVTRSKAEQAEWDEIMADRTYQHAAIHRTMVKHDAVIAGRPVGRTSVETHRGNAHRVAKT